MIYKISLQSGRPLMTYFGLSFWMALFLFRQSTKRQIHPRYSAPCAKPGVQSSAWPFQRICPNLVFQQVLIFWKRESFSQSIGFMMILTEHSWLLLSRLLARGLNSITSEETILLIIFKAISKPSYKWRLLPIVEYCSASKKATQSCQQRSVRRPEICR